MRQTLRRSLLFCTVLSLGAPVASFAGTTYYLVQTTITGANTKIDEYATSTWTFTPTTSFDLGGGALVMKDGPSTSTNLTLTLYDLTTQVGIVDMTNATFRAQLGQDQQWNPAYVFFVPPPPPDYLTSYTDAVAHVSPVTLLAGHHYSLTLTSPEPTNSAYFIKGITTSSTFGFVSDPGCTKTSTCVNDPVINQTVTTDYTVPEPDSLALLGGGVLLVGLGTYRKRKARK